MRDRDTCLLFMMCWLLSACGTPPTPVAIAPAATQPPKTPVQFVTPTTAAVPRILSFEVTPNPVERGQDLVVSWQVDGASQATLWRLWHSSKLNDWYRQTDPISSGSNGGEFHLTVPRDADVTLRFELEAKNAAGNSVTVTSDEIHLVCHDLFFNVATPPWCPNAPETTSAAFQAFEGGYMIWRSDTDMVYVLRRVAPDLPPDWFAFHPTDDVAHRPLPTAGFPLGEHFQRAWTSLPEQWQSLGRASAPEQTYTLTSQLSLSRGDVLSQNDHLYLTFPTGEIAHLLVYLSVSDQASGPAWSLQGTP